MPRTNPPVKRRTPTAPRRKKTASFQICNGQTPTSAVYDLTVEAASLSPVIRQKINKERAAPRLEIEGATDQNIQDMGAFLATMSLEPGAKLEVLYPVRSADPHDSLLGPSWVGDFASRLLKGNSLSSLLTLLYCAVGLQIHILEQVCFVCVAIMLKGKSIQEMKAL